MADRLKVPFYDDPDRIIWVQPQPEYVVASLEKTFYDKYPCLVALEQAANSMDKNLKKSSETLKQLNFFESYFKNR